MQQRHHRLASCAGTSFRFNHLRYHVTWNGWSYLCESIRIQGNKTPLMFISAKSSSKERIEGLKVGANDYLPKPFDLEELLLRTKTSLHKKSPVLNLWRSPVNIPFNRAPSSLMRLKSSTAMARPTVCLKKKSCCSSSWYLEKEKPSAEKKSWTRFGVMIFSLRPEPLTISSPISENTLKRTANIQNIFTV